LDIQFDIIFQAIKSSKIVSNFFKSLFNADIRKVKYSIKNPKRYNYSNYKRNINSNKGIL